MALSSLPVELWGLIARRLAPRDLESLFSLASTCRKWRRVVFSDVKRLDFSGDNVEKMPMVLRHFPTLKTLNVQGPIPDLSSLHPAVKLRKFALFYTGRMPEVKGTPNERVTVLQQRRAIRELKAAALAGILSKHPLNMLFFPFYLLDRKTTRRLVSNPSLRSIDCAFDAWASKFVPSRIKRLSVMIARSTDETGLNLKRFTNLRSLHLWMSNGSDSKLLEQVDQLSPMPDLTIVCPYSMIPVVAKLPVRALCLSGRQIAPLDPLLACTTLRYLRVKELSKQDEECLAKHPNAAHLELKRGS